jgi:hypothetical protein
MPHPILDNSISGIGPNSSAKFFSSAAPVGVQSSPLIFPPYKGE